MERQPVESSNIRSIGYDSSTDILQVEFKSNAVYNYYEVPENIYQELMSARSHGSYLNEHVKGRFVYSRII